MRWLDPGYRRWWWRNHSQAIGRGALAALALGVVALGGFVAADALEAAPTAVTYTTQRLVTVVRKVDGRIVTEVVRQTRTLTDTETAPSRFVTVVRDGREITLTLPARTVTDVETVNGKVVTHVRTETDVRTQTQTQHETQTVEHPPTTVTENGTTTFTTTEVRNVPGPERTVTVTETDHVPGPTTTVTDTATVTETVTEPAP